MWPLDAKPEFWTLLCHLQNASMYENLNGFDVEGDLKGDESEAIQTHLPQARAHSVAMSVC